MATRAPRTTYRCPGPDCDRQIPRHLFGCRSCWYTLPQDIRDDINDSWRHRKATGDAVPHRAATAKALRYWHRKQADS